MRVYFPATLTMLLELDEAGLFRPVGGTGFALTPALRESYVSGDDEELSEVALREAARVELARGVLARDLVDHREVLLLDAAHVDRHGRGRGRSGRGRAPGTCLRLSAARGSSP